MSKTALVSKIMQGESKVKVMAQHEVATLFENGIYDRRSSSNNYRSENGVLIHYGTIEGVRLKNGTVIKNTQCWSGGWAQCSLGWQNYNLPLSTISTIAGGSPANLPQKLAIVDYEDGSAVFTLSELYGTTKYYLYGYDDQYFIVELPRAVNSIKEAHESLRPEGCTKDTPRQGDLFFIPLTVEQELSTIFPIAPIEKAHYVPYMKDVYNGDTINTELRKELYVPQIPLPSGPSRHGARELLNISPIGGVYVRGYVVHPQHHKLTLTPHVWHKVAQNLAVRSYGVPRRGEGAWAD